MVLVVKRVYMAVGKLVMVLAVVKREFMGSQDPWEAGSMVMDSWCLLLLLL